MVNGGWGGAYVVIDIIVFNRNQLDYVLVKPTFWCIFDKTSINEPLFDVVWV